MCLECFRSSNRTIARVGARMCVTMYPVTLTVVLDMAAVSTKYFSSAYDKLSSLMNASLPRTRQAVGHWATFRPLLGKCYTDLRNVQAPCYGHTFSHLVFYSNTYFIPCL